MCFDTTFAKKKIVTFFKTKKRLLCERIHTREKRKHLVQRDFEADFERASEKRKKTNKSARRLG